VKIFQELTIKGEPSALERFVQEIESSLKGSWSRNKELEEQVKPLDPSPTWCFAFAGRGNNPAAYLWLAYREGNELYVPNIVPAGPERLSRDQYNRIVEEFYEGFAKEAAHNAGVHADLGKENVGLDDLLSEKAAQALQRFSKLANKSTGSSHPLDRKRWEGFLVSAHLEQSTLAPDELERWLVEEEQWPPDKASELAIEYEEAMSLLKAYDARIQ
jgi:hypothetical protein